MHLNNPKITSKDCNGTHINSENKSIPFHKLNQIILEQQLFIQLNKKKKVDYKTTNEMDPFALIPNTTLGIHIKKPYKYISRGKMGSTPVIKSKKVNFKN